MPDDTPNDFQSIPAVKAHRLLLSAIDRQRTDALRTARKEAADAIVKLQRLVESIDEGATPSPLFDLPDTRKLTESLVVAEAARIAGQTASGWIGMINA